MARVEPNESTRRVLLVLGAAAVGVLVGFFAAPDGSDATPRIVRGVSHVVNADGTATGIGTEGYVIGNGLTWQDLRGSWHQSGQPECLMPGSGGAEVEFGVIEVNDTPQGTALLNHVVWVRCLSEPTDFVD